MTRTPQNQLTAGLCARLLEGCQTALLVGLLQKLEQKNIIFENKEDHKIIKTGTQTTPIFSTLHLVQTTNHG